MELCKETLELQESCIEKNFNMVWDVIHLNHFEPNEDNFQVGCIGLLKAYRKFDSNMHTKFSTFAYPCIKNEILMSKRKKNLPVYFLDDVDISTVETTASQHDHYRTRSVDSIIRQAVNSVCHNERDKAIFFYIYKMKMDGYKLTQITISKKINVSAVKISRYVKKINQEIKSIIDKDCLL